VRLLHAARLSQKARNREQTGIESSDLEAQRWAQEHGHEIVETVADTKSGTTAMWARPNLKPWITEPDKLIQYDGIVAYKSDRLSRAEWSDEIQIRLWAQEHGKELFIISPALHWPPANQAEQLSWEIFASQAHEEWKNTSERYRRMQRYLKDQGKLVGRPPFGYMIVEAEGGHKTIAPSELGRKYVPEIFARCIAGDSLQTIANWLDSEGVKPQNSSSWNNQSIRKILLSPTYTGRRAEQDKKTGEFGRVILRCEPLVDTTTWRRAAEALANRPKRGPMRNEDKALLSGVLFCAGCGGPMYRNHKPGGRKVSYYYCVGAYPKRRSDCHLTVRCDAMDAAVDDFIAQLNLPIMQQAVVPGRDYRDEIEEIEHQISDLALRDLDEDDFDVRMAELRAERRRLKNLKPEPDRIDLVPVGETYAARWARHSPPNSGSGLRSSDVRVHASRDLGKVMALLAHSERTGTGTFPNGLIHGGDVFAALIINTLTSQAAEK
jgi:site-specific DNA recombinase